MSFRFFDLKVLRNERLSPSMARITFGSEDKLAGLACGGCDQSLSLMLPHPGQEAPVLPEPDDPDWLGTFRAMDPDVRAVMRSYTARAQRPGELDIDFVLHGESSPASRWAHHAAPGDKITMLGPNEPDNTGVRFRLPEDAGWVLLAADETALPATAAILEQLPAGLPAKVWIEIPKAEDIQDLATEADAEIVWLVGGDSSAPEAVRAAYALPSGSPYAWIAGEAGMIRTLRRHLIGERGFERKAITFTGYWRRGASEDQLREEA